MTSIYHYCAEDGTFRKVVPSDQAKIEVAGWRAVSGYLAVPRLREVRQMRGCAELVFDDVFTNHRCHGLLADLICDVDGRPELTEEVRALVNAVCDDLLRAIELTGGWARIEDCRAGLYGDRIASGGRLDQWYASWPRPAWIVNGERLDVRDLEDTTFAIHGRQYPSPWRGLLDWLRSELEANSRWLSALTQGDVTEPNIAVPLCWLDFEHAGRNVLAGDVANLIWYHSGNGWLAGPDLSADNV
jgi:hypothetical protein